MRTILTLLTLLTLVACQAGCGGKNASAVGAGQEPVVAVETARAGTETLEEVYQAVGSLEANEAVDIKAEIDAVVERIGFTEGAAVRKGDLLIQFDDTKWRAQYQQARVELENARIRAERAGRLLKTDSVSQQEYDDAQAAARSAEAVYALLEARLKETRIVAPFDGLVSERRVSPGAYVRAGDTLVRLVDLDPIKAVFNVPERYLMRLQPGQKVAVRVVSLGDRVFAGEVFFIDPQVDPVTRTIKVKARLDNPDGLLRPGLFANIALTIATHENATVIPEEAIVAQVGATVVFVVSDGRAQVRPIRTGLRLPGKVQVMEGLQPGEEVVTAGLQKLFPGVKVARADGPGQPPAVAN